MNHKIIVNILQTNRIFTVWLMVDFLAQIDILKGGVLARRKEQKNA